MLISVGVFVEKFIFFSAFQVMARRAVGISGLTCSSRTGFAVDGVE
jgi:hypothetical protein